MPWAKVHNICSKLDDLICLSWGQGSVVHSYPGSEKGKGLATLGSASLALRYNQSTYLDVLAGVWCKCSNKCSHHRLACRWVFLRFGVWFCLLFYYGIDLCKSSCVPLKVHSALGPVWSIGGNQFKFVPRAALRVLAESVFELLFPEWNGTLVLVSQQWSRVSYNTPPHTKGAVVTAFR